MEGTIVCGVTPTPEAYAAAQLAEALARRLGLRLVLLHVADGHGDNAQGEDLAESLARALPSGVTLRIVHGSRVDEFARVVADEGADLIVLAARAHGPRRRQLRCSLAQQLESAQSVPVLIAPPATQARNSFRLGLAESAADR
jgi:nucleotide-binding universal stress UspA family protein